MKKILVPVDFSGHTDITCRYAVEFAHVTGAEIKFFHTYFDQIIIADTSFPDTLDMSTLYNEELMKEISKQAMQNMEELEVKVNNLIRKENYGTIVTSSIVCGGELEHELKGICTDFHPDLVVMGTTGKGNNMNIWGKVSSFIIDHAKVPVITIPEIRGFKGFGHVMFAADLSEGNDATIAGILELFSSFQSKIHVVHFIKGGKQNDAYLRMKMLQMKFGKEEKTDRIKFEVVDIADDNQSAIDQFVAANQIDLIAFQPHKHNMLYMFFTKNITRKNLFATRIPLLSVPAAF
jgi:nucleotide-binding universal stress UspA family protein